MTTTTETTIKPSDLLREYANALRGDWGSIDGRSEKIALDWLADCIDEGDPLDPDAARASLDVCPHGGGHWTEHCWDGCAAGA